MSIIRSNAAPALVIALLAAIPVGNLVVARATPQGPHAGHHGEAAQASAGADNEAARAYRRAAADMHAAMGAPLTGDADLDFARGMVPHHQGAVEMARIELRHGRDPEMRRLAQEVVEAQEREIALMRAWVARREGGARAPAAEGAPMDHGHHLR